MKAANSYASLLRGVSQQVPQDRSEGQHTEQVNMLSDPVNGLTRRHGSEWRAEKLMAGLTVGQMAAYIADTAEYATFDFTSAGKEYAVCYRQAARPVSANPMPSVVVYNKTDRVFLNVVRNAVDARLDSLEANGVSAITAVGKYVFLAGRSVATIGTSTALWNTPTNFGRAVAWVRGGAYSRTYTVKVRTQAGAVQIVTYSTPSSSYQGVLDTSDIAASDPQYTKKVNDRVNEYNSDVTLWIGSSAAAIQPAAIAAQIAGSFNILGYACSTVGSHICFSSSANIKSIEVDDGGDGSLIRGVADEVESVDRVSVVHYPGKVVKIRSRTAAEAFYLKAVAKDQLVTSAYTEVTWVEAAGVEHAITSAVFYGTASGSTFYMASSATLLNLIVAGAHPTYVVSNAGDDDSAPMPFFVGRSISYLGTFQNRLLVGSGGVLAVSQTEDYLNFFRSTVLTLPASDAFEMLPQGSEDDELEHSVLYNQDLVVFGKKRQYVINGSTALTPTAANMAVMSTYVGTADAAPVAAGGFIFYAKRGTTYSSLHQVQPGLTDKSPESFPASSQIDSYLLGNVTEMVSVTGSPSAVYLRTSGSRNSIYAFAYLDKQDGRKMDSWSRWDFNPVLGNVIGMSVGVDGINVLSLRTDVANRVFVVADFCPTVTTLSSKPYLDSHRPWAQVSAGTGSVVAASGSSWAAAFDSTSDRRFTGTLLPNVTTLQASYPGEPGLTVGAVQEAYVVPTNPFMRDSKGKAIISGRLTISKFLLGFKDSTGFKWTLTYRDQVVTTVEFNGRILGDPSNLIGIEPVTTGQHPLPVGRETRQFELKVEARRWYPFTLTALEWVGQSFNRVQRF